MRSILLVVILAGGITAGVGLGRALEPRGGAEGAFAPEASAALRQQQDSFRAAAKFAMRSVVHITTQGAAPAEFWLAQENVGSGVIVSDEGHVLTNNHVVEAARTLRVRFVDGKEFAAKVVGRDSESDLALLKIEVPRDVKLAPAAFANSDEVEVGDLCLAIGSPYGYNHTVTAGIVSAKHRRAHLASPYQDFIQTDAAINPGNSGGALVNIRGELIGINTAIVTESRGNEGIGLAISANFARWVKDRLMQDGRVRRGYLGIRMSDIDERLVYDLRQDGIRSLKDLMDEVGLKEPRGVFVRFVEPNSPAEKGGLKSNDVILELGGKPVSGQNEILFKIAEISPGTQVGLKILRDRSEKALMIELGERPPMDLGRPRRR